ncbi:MAG TPA: hypothetical protein VK175_18670 [Leadbetterella sp.]|nr:hypothetical protein [Leadbetterella sp.]
MRDRRGALCGLALAGHKSGSREPDPDTCSDSGMCWGHAQRFLGKMY